MGEDIIQLPVDSTGKKIRTYSHVVGVNTVHEETVQVTDGAGTVVDPRSVTEANSAAIKTALEIIDNIVSGNEAQVDVSAAVTVTINCIYTDADAS